MKKEKLVISLIIMIVLVLMFAVNAFAAGESITPIRTGNSATPTNTASRTGNNTGSPITPSNSAISVGGDESTGAGSNANQASQLTPTNNTAGTGSSYRNVASNTSGDLPYTGSSYGIVFIIVALVVSAVYAYKKVSDYNM